MSKVCKSCKASNPDSAHYCGNCGKPLETDWNGGVNYSVVRTSEYTYLKSQLDRIKRENEQMKKKLESNIFKKIGNWWSDFKSSDTGGAVLGVSMIVIGVVAFFFIGYWLFTLFGGDKLERIQVGDKYGVGYDKDNLKLEALYDTISPKDYGSQWMIMDKEKGLYGFAYVTDSVTKVVEPTYASYSVYQDGNVMMTRTDESFDHYYQGEKMNGEPYKRYTPITGAYIVLRQDFSFDIIAHDGTPITNKRYSNMYFDNDSVVRAVEQRDREYITTLFDREGKPLTDKEFHGVREFSDGVAWANVELDDVRNSRYSLIDTRGNVLFTLPEKVYSVREFSDGVGFYKYDKSGSCWTAVDKSGKTLLTLPKEVWNVYPVTMGLIPVNDKSWKLGFVDMNGREVIPCKYKKYYANDPEFNSSDSIMFVTLDGVKGYLHRNGTFTPLEKMSKVVIL